MEGEKKVNLKQAIYCFKSFHLMQAEQEAIKDLGCSVGSSASVCRWPNFFGGPGGGVLWLRYCLRPGWADLQAAWGHVLGILPMQPGGGQSSHSAAAGTSGV